MADGNLYRRMENKLAQRFLGLSIRQKILLIVMVTCGVALFFTFGMFMVYNSLKLRDSMVQELTVLGEIIGNRSTAALIYDDDKVAAENLEAFSAKRSIMMACMYDQAGDEFARYARGPEVLLPCPRNPEKGAHFEQDYLYLYQDIFLTGEKVGSVYVHSDLTTIRDNFLQYTTYALLSILFGSVLAYFISSRLLKVISDPISSLVATAKAVSENYNYSVRAEKTTEDELGVMVDAFNDMLYQIHERDKQVIAAKEGLELRVIRRTKALEIAKKAAEEASRAKSWFLANMSHELRTPMHAILSYADFGADEVHEAPKEDLLKYFKRIHESGNRLLQLLNNLLDLSKLEAGKMDFQMKEDDLRKPLAVVMKELQVLLEEKNLTMHMPPSDFIPMAVFDSGKIVQVLHNLLANAIKFSPVGGRITVTFERAEIESPQGRDKAPAISISVRDEGVGIPEGELEKVFDKFVQSSKTRTGAGGTGLGLAICAEIIQEHGGRIWCRNGKAGGAVFTFVLPADGAGASR